MQTLPTPSNNQRSSGKLTVLVFREGLSPKAFKVPLHWISELGLAISALLIISILAIAFSVKFYFQSREADPNYIASLKAKISELESNQQASGDYSSQDSDADETEAPPPADMGADLSKSEMGTSKSLVGVSVFPANVKDQSATWTPTIKLTGFQTSWKANHTFNVKFNIQYINPGKGSQQGRIVIVARGKNVLMAYPAGVLSHASPGLLTPANGEYFSVSRFRAVEAQFTPVVSQPDIQEADIYIFDQEQKLLMRQTIDIGAQRSAPATSRPAPPPVEKVKPAEPKTAPEPITPTEPGVESNE